MGKYANLTLAQYLTDLSSDKPVPGGGSVSAYVASLSMGLTQMVGRIALKRKPKEPHSAEAKQDIEDRKVIQKIIDSVEKNKTKALEIVDLDPEVYQEVCNAWGKSEKMEDALQNSFRLQADLALLVVMAREWNANLARIVKGSIANDLLVSASLSEAAFHGAAHTAMINAKYMKDAEKKLQAEKALEELKSRFNHGGAGD